MIVTIPGCPDEGLSPNARLHWRRHAKLKAEARGTAKWAAHDAVPMAQDWPAFDGPVRVRITIGWGKGRKRVDPDNALAMLKYHLDGLTGIVWADDKLCRFAPVEQTRDPDGRGYVELRITEETT